MEIVHNYKIKKLVHLLSTNPVFENISTGEIKKLINYSIDEDYLKKIRSELILGMAGEKIVNSRDFYSVFSTEPDFKVIHSGRKVGQIPFSPQIKVNENLLLAAKYLEN